MVDDENKPFTLCPRCRQKVEPTDPDVHFAVEMRRIDSFGGTEYVEGMGGYFHPDCRIPAEWKPKDMP
jgi:hypothetical protein